MVSEEMACALARNRIEESLRRHGAERFICGWDGDEAVIAFDLHGWRIRIPFYLPSEWSDAFAYTPSGQARGEEQRRKTWEQACRPYWRCVLDLVDASLQAIAWGIGRTEDIFLPYIQHPDGGRGADHWRGHVHTVYDERALPPLIPEAFPVARADGQD